jgi:uncharacterized small protein (DUF1192 family)
MKYSEDKIKLFAGEILEVIENCVAIQESEINRTSKEQAKKHAFDEIAALCEK